MGKYKVINVLILLVLVNCDEPEENIDITGTWKFFKRSTDIFITSDVDQYAILPYLLNGDSISIRGKYNYDLKQLAMWYQDSINAQIYLFYAGAPWIFAPPQLTIFESNDTTIAEFKYDLKSEYGPDLFESFHPTSFEFTFIREEGIFEIPPTIFYSDTGSGEVIISASVNFNSVQLFANQFTLFSKLFSESSPDKIDTIQIQNDGSICITFSDRNWTDSLCGEWTLSDKHLVYDLSNERHGEYDVNVDRDTLVLSTGETYEYDPLFENWLWISEYPESITEYAIFKREYYYR